MADKQEISLAGFHITKTHAERNPEFKGKLEIASSINISNIEKFKPEQSKQELVKIIFNFGISYKTLGNVSVSGELFLSADPKTFKEIISDWKDKKQTSNTHVAIMNIIMQKASLKALQLEDDVGLPPHINIPVLRHSEEKSK
ncbi:MAG: hypothetical protein WCP89_04435 [archaeon]